MGSAYADYPPSLDSAQQDFLVQKIKDWSAQNGLMIRPGHISKDVDPNGVLATNAPVTVFPSPFPRSCFEQAQGLQTLYNKLYAEITCDVEWLSKIMADLIEVDDFVSRLWKVHQAVDKEGYAQTLSLGLYRSDYMPHAGPSGLSLKQIEFNTISSSFGGLSTRVAALHTELLNSPGYPSHPLLDSNKPPVNTAVQTLAAGLAAGHTAYGPSKSTPALPKCILFVIQDGERNIFDQLALSEQLERVHEIPVFRLLRSEILEHTSIPASNPSRPLVYTPPYAKDAPYEVSTVYLRCFYAPTDYVSERDWEARTHLERSAAIKCPTVLNQLAGCKIVQQVLASTEPDHLKSFLSETDPAVIQSLRDTFAPQYDLNGRGRELALNPVTAANHVLKPQREGGGNNIYKTDIPDFLRSIPESEWKRWILMELITPPDAKNVALRSDGEVLSGNVISELGIYGTILWDQKSRGQILHNEEGGWLLRTKAKDVNEGGVATGFSSLDGIILF
ncbi:glutathione synthase [Aspergillus campestris IBT 28561]|uniref:Glutathione synthetase n=1 Tax=Aspergillus campestris (strain IBT 28561) TaxID=1392248 RepID=A0A2I1D3K4_ASPC2|nr:glutathione synthase [Aspergillus campestris IBT 28561]PKY04454.1 glutathione synthase [Aspergillus campestris IBT 28561]